MSAQMSQFSRTVRSYKSTILHTHGIFQLRKLHEDTPKIKNPGCHESPEVKRTCQSSWEDRQQSKRWPRSFL